MNHSFASKTKKEFYKTIFAAAIALVATVFVFLKIFQLSGLYLEILIHKIKDACGCADMSQFFSMHPDIFRVVILFGVGIGVFIIYSAYKLIKLISRTRKYTARHLSFARKKHSMKLKAAIKALGLDGARVVEINNAESIVFCFGFWRPKICISRALVDMLDEIELKAVLKHEAQHMNSYEPFKILIIKYFGSIFYFLPILKNSLKRYVTLSELAADEKASKNSLERSGLAGAILKISEREEYRILKSGSSLSFFSSTIEDRVNRLSNEAYTPEFNLFDKSLIIGSLGLIIVSFAVLLIFSNSTKALEMHSNSGCIAPNNSSGDLFRSLTGRQNIHNMDSDIFHGINKADLGQNSICRPD